MSTDNQEIIKSEDKDVIEETVVEEIIVDEDVIQEEIEDSKKEKGFFSRILAGTIDQIVAIALSLGGFVLFDLLLHLFGFYVVEREPIFLAIYIIMNIIYAPILESSKMKKTIGKKILFK